MQAMFSPFHARFHSGASSDIRLTSTSILYVGGLSLNGFSSTSEKSNCGAADGTTDGTTAATVIGLLHKGHGNSRPPISSGTERGCEQCGQGRTMGMGGSACLINAYVCYFRSDCIRKFCRVGRGFA